MATYYVADFDGNDAYTGLSPSFVSGTNGPFKSLVKAITTAISGDTIYIRSGTYNTNNANGYLINESLTISSYNNESVKITVGVAAQVVWFNPGASPINLSISKIEIDAQNLRNYCVNISGTAGLHSLVMDNVVFTNPIKAFIETTISACNITITYTKGNGVCTDGGIEENSGSYTGTMSLLNNNWTITGMTKTARGAIFARGGATPGTVKAISNTIVLNTNAAANIGGIRCENVIPIIRKNNITMLGSAAYGVPIMCSPVNLNSVSFGIIEYNTVTNLCPSNAVLILWGTDVSGVNDYTMNNPIIRNNVCTGNNAATGMHGIMIANANGGKVYGNIVDTAALCLVIKQQAVGGYMCNNFVRNPIVTTSGVLRIKGTVNARMSNNTVIVDTANTGYIIYVSAGDSAQNCSGCVSESNVININNRQSVTKIVQVDALQVCSFDKNNYYNSELVFANMWTYQGSNYADIAAWNASASVGVDYERNPILDDYFRPDINSPLISGCSRYPTTNELPSDPYGQPLGYWGTDIGCFQSIKHPFFPGRIT